MRGLPDEEHSAARVGAGDDVAVVWDAIGLQWDGSGF
jgi:hypothetical protein